MTERRANTKRPDVVIVGAGGTGAVVAKEIGEAGLGVVVLEAGPWHHPQRDFNGLEWEMLNPFDSVFRWGPTDRNAKPWPRIRDGLGMLVQTAGVGGNTLRSGGTSPRAYIDAVERDWPLSYRDLIPYYYKVEDTLPVVVPDSIAHKDELFMRGCEAIGLEWNPGPDIRTPGWRFQPNAILPVAERTAPLAYPRTDGCTMCGECTIGCRNPDGAPLERTAKRGTNVSYAPLAHATGLCEFRTGCFATQIIAEEHEGGMRARAIRYRDPSGRLHEQDGEVFVLCAGAIESPRLWLASELPSNASTGRYLTTHWLDYVSGVLPDDVDMFEGQSSMMRAEFPGYGFIETQGMGPLQLAMATSFGPKAIRGAPPWSVSGRSWGSDLKRRLEAYRRTLTIALSVDDDAVHDNGVTLAAGVADENNPAPAVRYRPTPETIERRDWLAKRAAEVLVAAGADPATIHRTDAAPSTINMHGTMRMGVDPGTSMVDPDGESHAVKRVFVADTSIFPNGLGGAAPTLTAQALATRISEKIMERHFS